MDYQVMAFDETTLSDFHDVILPNVLAELYALDDFADYGILAVGAMQNGQAIGAVIARILSEVDVQLLSLYVAPKFRRAGVAAMMIDGIAALCFDLFDTVERPERAAIRILKKLQMSFDPRSPDLFQTEMQRAAAPRQAVHGQNAPVQGRQQRSSSVANRPAAQTEPNQSRPRSSSVKSSGPVKQ